MIGLLGGTFNPVHWGHVRTALEIKRSLSLEAMLLIPCRIPPHRAEPNVKAATRLAMLRAAIEDVDDLEIDERELNRPGASYTVDTLTSLHHELPAATLGLCMGVDAFIHLDSWHEWQRLFALAHIIIAHRPGWTHDNMINQVSEPLREAIKPRIVTDKNDLQRSNNGLILPLRVTDIDISSSEIRRRIAQGEPVSDMLPPGVLEIIERENLYQSAIA